MVVKFDLSSIPVLDGATFSSATLSLFAKGPYYYDFKTMPSGDKNHGNGPKKVHHVENSWEESTVTWKNYGYPTGKGNDALRGELITENNNTSFDVWEDFDVTSAVLGHISDPSTNNGFMVIMEENSSARYMVGYHSSESSNETLRPKLIITYTTDGDVYNLTVENGSGSTYISEGQSVSITAKDSMGYQFDHWSGDSEYLADSTVSTTTVNMSAKDITVRALYTELPNYTFSVVNGSNSGIYKAGDAVTVTAIDSAGFVFDTWSGDVDILSDVNSKTTVATLKDRNATVTATYREYVDLEIVPVELSNISLESFSSEYAAAGRYAISTIDGDSTTFWHNDWATGSDTLPQSLTYKLEKAVEIAGFRYQPRQDGSENGRVKDYRFEISTDGSSWREMNSGAFENGINDTIVEFGSFAEASYVRFTVITDQTGNPWATMAEFRPYKLAKTVSAESEFQAKGMAGLKLGVSAGNIELSIPSAGSYSIVLMNARGQIVQKMENVMSEGVHRLSLSNLGGGIYLCNIKGGGQRVSVKLFVP